MGSSLLGKCYWTKQKHGIHADDVYLSDPDHYGFRMAHLPHDLTMAPHSEDAEEIVIHESVPGVSITGKWLVVG